MFLAHCYFEAAETDWAIDEQNPGLKSMPQYFTVILRARYEDIIFAFIVGCMRHLHSVCCTYRDEPQHANMKKIKNEMITMWNWIITRILLLV